VNLPATTRYLRHPGLLGSIRRRRLVESLNRVSTVRARSSDLGRTGRGTMEQLVPGTDDYCSAELATLRQVVASVCYNAVATAFALPEPAGLAPQVFPVWMTGSVEAPPSQHPHVDNRDGQTPLVTTVYYAHVSDTDGGEIVIGVGADELVFSPVEDELLAFRGDTLHAVQELRAGHRLSVVCNFHLAQTAIG